MSRSGENTPSQNTTSSAATLRSPTPTRRGNAAAETFGSFVRNLARLENTGGRHGKGGEGRR